MSHREHNRAVIQELRRINETIDRKIIHGESYRAEAKRHFQLLRLLRRSRSRWYSLLSSFALF